MKPHHQHFVSSFGTEGEHDWLRLDRADFGRIFDLPVPEEAGRLIDTLDFRYRALTPAERDRQILKILKILDEPLVVSGPKRQEAWEAGWGENLEEFKAAGFAEEALLPYYYRRGRTVMRLRDDYILPHNPRFEADFLSVLQIIVARAYFADVPAIHEFGCGPGHNLAAFSRIVPGKEYHGFDWAGPSAAILELADRHLPKSDPGNRLAGHFIDLFNPALDRPLVPGGAVFTFGSMEQLGSRFQPFLDLLLEQPAGIVVQIEPFSEFRDPELLFDVLADRYATKRGYLNGYLDRLRVERDAGKVEILQEKKLLGSTFYDGWCLVAWRRRN